MRVKAFSSAIVAAAAAGVNAGVPTITVPGDAPTIAAAFDAAMDGFVILAGSSAFSQEPTINWLGKAVRLESNGSFTQGDGGLYLMAPGSQLVAADGSGEFFGELRSPAGGAASVQTSQLRVREGGLVNVLPGALFAMASTTEIDLQAGSATIVGAGAALTFDSDFSTKLSGAMSLAPGSQLVVATGGSGQFSVFSNGSFVADQASVLLSTRAFIDGPMTLFSCFTSIANELTLSNSGLVNVFGGSLVVGATCNIDGALRLFDRATLTGGEFNLNGELSLFDADLSALQASISGGGLLRGAGFWVVDLVNDGDVAITADTTLVGDIVNQPGGVITIQIGTLTIVGSLDDSGTIVGDLVPPLSPPAEGGATGPNGVAIGGDYAAAAAAALLLPGPDYTMRVGGGFDVAIDDNDRFDMIGADLIVGTLAGATTTFEAMSADLGPDGAGLDPSMDGAFPLGSLTVAAATVTLVDERDNDLAGQAVSEAVYTKSLTVAAGASLITDGRRVYTLEAVVDGAVDDPANVIVLTAPPACPEDLNGDGSIGSQDLNIVLAAFGATADGDVNADGVTDSVDLNLLLASFGDDCPAG